MTLQLLLNNEAFLWISAFLFLATSIITLIIVPLIIVRIPEDYFKLEHRKKNTSTNATSFLHLILIIIKNFLGVILIITGIALLVLPGQGILTILMGSMIVNFPGKYRMERWLVQRKPVIRSINWIRKKNNHPPLKFH